MTMDHLRALDRARNRLDAAKAEFSAAAQAGLRGDKDAAERAGAAYREVEAARLALRALTDQAPGEWAISARVRDDA